MSETVYIMLGGNVGPTRALFQKALKALELLAKGPIRLSKLYLTHAVSPVPQADYLNCACSFETELEPVALMQTLQELELRLGKVPKPKEAPRPIDLDLIFYGSRKISSEYLNIPHPRWQERLFVVRPLRDLAEGISIEDQWVSFDPLLAKLTDNQRDWVEPIDDLMI
jgi:2-amino-4-hydroxy-6-hydroxymethyldihydropteridine diphosphokinase